MFKAIVSWVVLFVGKIHWRPSAEISESDKSTIMSLISKDYFIVLTRRNNHLSTYLTSLASFFVTGKFSYWSHALMNLEDAVVTSKDFRLAEMNKPLQLTAKDRVLIEATGEGTHISSFDDVFDVQGVVLLKPKCMTVDEWTGTLDYAKSQLGKPYDTLFNIADDRELSCVELVRIILRSRDKYAEEFPHFEEMIAEHGNLTPQMYYDCEDFEVVFESRV